MSWRAPGSVQWKWNFGMDAGLTGKIVQRDRRRDLAAIQVEASGLPAVTAGDSNALRVGELVIAVGNPLGFIGAASTGVVHGFENRSWVVSQLRLGARKFRRPAGERSRRGGGDQYDDCRRTRVCDSVSRRQAIPERAQPTRTAGSGVVVRPIRGAGSSC